MQGLESRVYYIRWVLLRFISSLPVVSVTDYDLGIVSANLANDFCFYAISIFLKGGLTMRGIHKKGKNGPGLTGIQRVLNTRERVQEVEDPCKVTDCVLGLKAQACCVSYCTLTKPHTSVGNRRTNRGRCFVVSRQWSTRCVYCSRGGVAGNLTCRHCCLAKVVMPAQYAVHLRSMEYVRHRTAGGKVYCQHCCTYRSCCGVALCSSLSLSHCATAPALTSPPVRFTLRAPKPKTWSMLQTAWQCGVPPASM